MRNVIWRVVAVVVVGTAAVATFSIEDIHRRIHPGPLDRVEKRQARWERHVQGVGVEYDSTRSGPFGLCMGMTVDDFPEAALMQRADGCYSLYVVPKPNRDINRYLLRFDPRFGLWEIVAIKNVTDLYDGRRELRPWFYRFVNALEAVYGEGVCSESLFDDHGKFLRNDDQPPSTQPPEDFKGWCSELASDRRRVWAHWKDNRSILDREYAPLPDSLEAISCRAFRTDEGGESIIQIVYRFKNHVTQVASTEGL